jgi:putative membrane protein
MNKSVSKKYSRYVLALAFLLAVVWVILAISPVERGTWAMENALAIGLVAVLVLTYRIFPLSRISYTLIFVYLTLHLIGAHYTYSLVPYDQWFEAVFGKSLNSLLGWDRNHYDRLVHFCYGLLLAYPIREFFLRVADAKGFWGYFFPLDITMSTSMLYELIEWRVAVTVGGTAGGAFLGTQGDEWDAHKDMALASLGALLSMLITLAVNMCLKRDFARDWNESLRIKRKEPLGEEELARMLKENNE